MCAGPCRAWDAVPGPRVAGSPRTPTARVVRSIVKWWGASDRARPVPAWRAYTPRPWDGRYRPRSGRRQCLPRCPLSRGIPADPVGLATPTPFCTSRYSVEPRVALGPGFRAGGHPREARPPGTLSLRHALPNQNRRVGVNPLGGTRRTRPPLRAGKPGPVRSGAPQASRNTAASSTAVATRTTITSTGTIVCGSSCAPSAAGPASPASLTGPLSGRALYRSASWRS